MDVMSLGVSDFVSAVFDPQEMMDNADIMIAKYFIQKSYLLL
jgi:hypothetical protein